MKSLKKWRRNIYLHKLKPQGDTNTYQLHWQKIKKSDNLKGHRVNKRNDTFKTVLLGVYI